jgi:hypothetical protein
MKPAPLILVAQGLADTVASSATGPPLMTASYASCEICRLAFVEPDALPVPVVVGGAPEEHAASAMAALDPAAT